MKHLYIIKISCGNKIIYKVGQSKNNLREKLLQEKYSAKNSKIRTQVLANFELPDYLNDHDIHKNLTELEKASVDLWLMTHCRDGYTEAFKTSKSDSELLIYIKNILYKLSHQENG